MKKWILLILIIFYGCKHQPPKIADTLWPQAEIKADKNTLHDRLIGRLSAMGFTIIDDSDSLIQTTAPDNNAGLAKAFFGCGLCGDPYLRINFVLSSINENHTLIVIQYWRMVPQFNGGETKMAIDSNTDFNIFQQKLNDLQNAYNSPAAEYMN